MCFIKFEVYLNMLSGKIITSNPALSRIIISRAPSQIRPELSPASQVKDVSGHDIRRHQNPLDRVTRWTQVF